jgi:hypothetical protein
MKAIIPGYRYALNNFVITTEAQQLQFIEKDAAMNIISDGTTNEEVLLMLIDRLRFLGERLPSRENAIAITKCEEVLMWLLKRTADRAARGVEGTSQA